MPASCISIFRISVTLNEESSNDGLTGNYKLIQWDYSDRAVIC